MSFVHASRVRFVDTDASGRIHYTAMLRYFEASEAEFFRANGLRLGDIQATGISWPRVHVECTYTGPVRYDDLVDVAVSVNRVGNSSYTLAFSGTLAGRPAAHGSITIVCLDTGTQRSRPLPEELATKSCASWQKSETQPQTDYCSTAWDGASEFVNCRELTNLVT